MRTIKLDNIRLGGRDPVTVELKELEWGDEEDISYETKEEKLNMATMEKEPFYDLVKVQRLRMIRSICSHKVTIEDIRKTPRIDVLKIRKAYSELNEVTDTEKSGSSETGMGGEPAEEHKQITPKQPDKALLP